MKKTVISIILLAAMLLSACTPGIAEQTTAAEETTQAETTAAETTAETTEEAVTTEEETTAPETETETETEAQTTEEVTVTETEAETEAPDEEGQITLVLPKNSSDVSHELALDLLAMASGGGEAATKNNLTVEGFEVLFTKHYDKNSDISHTCAYAVGKGRYKGKNVYAIVIRGTSGGEWYSNFDFAPSHDNNTQYAENFLLSAQDIYLSVKEMFDEDKDALFIVTGHSRGAAAANLLGTLLDTVYGAERVYAYTFATPNTVRGEEAEKSYTNIFNYINPNDIVTHLPLEAHGYKRVGVDIVLDPVTNKSPLIDSLPKLTSVAPDIESYYNKKYALDAPGLSDTGVSPFDLMIGLVIMLAGSSADTSLLPKVSEDSDLYPLVSFMSSFAGAGTVFSDHMPSMYRNLIMEKFDL